MDELMRPITKAIKVGDDECLCVLDEKDESSVSDLVYQVKTGVRVPIKIPPILSNTLAQLYNSETFNEYADVIFEVGENRVERRAHVFVISAYSNSLRVLIREKQMARESMEETEDVVTVPVPTASVADFETALKFAYTRVAPTELSIEDIERLYVLAIQLDMPSLRDCLTTTLTSLITDENVCRFVVNGVAKRSQVFGCSAVIEKCKSIVYNSTNIDTVGTYLFYRQEYEDIIELLQRSVLTTQKKIPLIVYWGQLYIEACGDQVTVPRRKTFPESSEESSEELKVKESEAKTFPGLTFEDTSSQPTFGGATFGMKKITNMVKGDSKAESPTISDSKSEPAFDSGDGGGAEVPPVTQKGEPKPVTAKGASTTTTAKVTSMFGSFKVTSTPETEKVKPVGTGGTVKSSSTLETIQASSSFGAFKAESKPATFGKVESPFDKFRTSDSPSASVFTPTPPTPDDTESPSRGGMFAFGGSSTPEFSKNSVNPFTKKPTTSPATSLISLTTTTTTTTPTTTTTTSQKSSTFWTPSPVMTTSVKAPSSAPHLTSASKEDIPNKKFNLFSPAAEPARAVEKSFAKLGSAPPFSIAKKDEIPKHGSSFFSFPFHDAAVDESFLSDRFGTTLNVCNPLCGLSTPDMPDPEE